MNANAYGGELAAVLDLGRGAHGRRARAARAGRARPRLPVVEPRAGEIVARAEFVLEPAPPAAVRARLADLRPAPTRPSRRGSGRSARRSRTRRGETAGLLLARAGAGALRVGGARFSPKHANFVENLGEATTADVVALMAAGRSLVAARFGVELEAEVQTPRAGPLPLVNRRGTVPVHESRVDASPEARRRRARARRRLRRLVRLLRDAPIFAVQKVTITGLSGVGPSDPDVAGRGGARMTTTHFDVGRLRAAVASFALVKASHRRRSSRTGCASASSRRSPSPL